MKADSKCKGAFLMRVWWRVGLVWLLVWSASVTVAAQVPTESRPLIPPVAAPPSPSTWMFGQAYGNTVGAYNFGDRWYRAGQGLHFGVDMSMPCGTPLVAVADGVVQFVDDMGFGSAPHNLIIRHDALGITSLYGHLLQPAPVFAGQIVQQGQTVGLSGDPDETCVGRPHLHLEIRSLDYSQTYNPVDYMAGNWHSWALIGPYSYPLFQQNLYNPRQWVTLEEQPTVRFWGARLNEYTATYPPAYANRAAPMPTPYRVAPALEENPTYTARQVTADGCCAFASWHPVDAGQVYVMDGAVGELAGVVALDVDAPDTRYWTRPAPLPLWSPLGIYEVELSGSSAILRTADGGTLSVNTNGQLPTLNPSNTRLLWTDTDEVIVPGQAQPLNRVYISNTDGSNVQLLMGENGASGRWLSDETVLISLRDNQRRTRLITMDVRDGGSAVLGEWFNMRGLDTSPGGRYVAFYLSWQENPSDNGVYLIDTADDNRVIRPRWFGAWRWRDADTLYVIPFEPNEPTQTLAVYDIAAGTLQPLTDRAMTPFSVANGDWSISADGTRVLYQSAVDSNLYVLEPSS
jgi:hypothetical protein